MIINALRTAHTGMRRQADEFAAAVRKITRATLPTEAAQPTEPTVAGSAPPMPSATDQWLDGMTEMMIAQRMFAANLRAAETAADMLDEVTELGR